MISIVFGVKTIAKGRESFRGCVEEVLICNAIISYKPSNVSYIEYYID